MPWITRSVYVSGLYGYAGGDNTALQVFGIANPEKPVWVGFSPINGEISGIFVSRNYAYVAEKMFFRLYVVNISNPAFPVKAGIDNSTRSNAVYVAGDYAYLAAGSSGLQIIKIMNPP